MSFFKGLIKNYKIKYLCGKDKHDWEYCTWGSAFVDNLDGTFSNCELSKRTCLICNKHQVHLKNGWEDDKKITIDDL